MNPAATVCFRVNIVAPLADRMRKGKRPAVGLTIPLGGGREQHSLSANRCILDGLLVK